MNFIDVLKKPDGWLSLGAAIVGTLVAGSTVFFGFNDAQDRVRTFVVDSNNLDILNSEFEDVLKTQREELQLLLKSTLELPEESKVAARIAGLENGLKEIGDRLSGLENAILESPVKALEIPLLKKDLENLRGDQNEGMISLKLSIDRIYDLTKWLLGGLSVSIASLAFVNLLKRKDQPRDE